MASPDYQTQKNDPTVHSPTVNEPEGSEDEYDDPPEEEIIDYDDGRAVRAERAARAGEPKVQTHFHDRGKAPAYVAPIGKIGRISPFTPTPTKETPPPTPPTNGNGTNGISSYGRPTLPRFLTARLVGKTIDEYGDVMSGGPDGKTSGEILGQVAGDLPAMVGRTVSNENGDLLDDDGDLLGYVDHVTTEAERRKMAEDRQRRDAAAEAQSLDEFTRGGSSAFRVDSVGNILDGAGDIVGRMNGADKKEEEKEGGAPPKENAESYRKEGESPSDIFLDVKSTTEGIQLTIRIPTVFPTNGQPPRVPKVNFS